MEALKYINLNFESSKTVKSNKQERGNSILIYNLLSDQLILSPCYPFVSNDNNNHVKFNKLVKSQSFIFLHGISIRNLLLCGAFMENFIIFVFESFPDVSTGVWHCLDII